MGEKRKKPASKAGPPRRSPKKISYLYDQAVPAAFLFHGILPSVRPGNKPTVRVTDHPNFSPFVIHLNAPSLAPSAIIEEQSRLVRLNFLVPEAELRRASLLPDLAPDALTLRETDLAGQLGEEDLTGALRVSAPTAIPQIALPTLAEIRRAFVDFQTAYPMHEPPAEVFDLRRLIPERPALVAFDAVPSAAAALASHFDLPEAEDEADESEVVTLDDLRAFAELTAALESDAPSAPRAAAKSPKPSRVLARLADAYRAIRNWNPPKISFTLPRLVVFELPDGWHRALAAFVLVSFAFVLPLHAMGTLQDLRSAAGDIRTSGLSAFNDLRAAAGEVLTRDPSGAAATFSQAQMQFSSAQSTLDHLSSTSSLLLSTWPSTHASYQAGKDLVAAGSDFAEAGKRLSQGLAGLDTPATNPTAKLAVLSSYLTSALPLLEDANTHISRVDPSVVPEDEHDMFTSMQNSLPEFVSSIKDVNDFSTTLATLLGADQPRRYLLLFQNNTELRPTGGFLGSFAVLDVHHGSIENVDIPGGGTYDLQGSLRDYVIAPEALRLLNARWEFQDANWFVDFPTSARHVMDFYGEAGGPSVDGVIAVNATFLSSLLNVLGPVDMPAYGQTIDAENFIFNTEKIVEQDYKQYATVTDRTVDAPKAFIGDLATTLIARANTLDRDQILDLLDHVDRGLSQKDIQVYLADNATEKTILARGWGGEVKQTSGDSLLIVDTNLGGGKTDGVISEDAHLAVDIQSDGSIIDTLTLSRTHHGLANELFTGVNNVDYLRVYVPQGSTLLHADGFTIPDQSLFEMPDPTWRADADVQDVESKEQVDPGSLTVISDEFGKTVFGNWVQTKPGSTSTVTFRYKLPFSVQMLARDPSLLDQLKASIGLDPMETYTLTAQRQSGVLDRTIHVAVTAPPTLKTVWRSQEGDTVDLTQKTDDFYSLLFESNR